MTLKRANNVGDSGAIAIIGMAGRFPGAPDIAAFWRNLCDGVESVSRFDAGEREGDSRAGAAAVAGRGVLDDADLFDAGLFAMHAREAELTDPQHRVALECAWTALEDAGYDPSTYAGTIGVVAGCSMSSYFLRNVLRDGAAITTFTTNYQADSFPELLGSGHDFLATRIAYKLNLRGPALTVASACSTGLLAVAQGCQALMLGQADMMVAGAASITFPQQRGYAHQEGGMLSADGYARTFDAKASGTVFGSGAGAIVLKRLSDAIADGDTMYAVVRGFGITNDGSAKIGYTAPSVAGQAAAIAAAHAMAGFDPASIDYVECHGTATPLGDPIEIAALTAAFRDAGEPRSCALGSVKTNIGHLDAAAGMSGIIKAALAIRHGKIPPTLHYTAPNPHIDFSAGPFYVNTTLAEWPGAARRAGVSAFGLGGTNVHVVLEAAPAQPVASAPPAAQVLVLSARSEAALDAARVQLCAHLETASERDLGSVAFTLQSGRRAFPYRLALTATTAAEAAARLRDAGAGTGVRRGHASGGEPRVAFMFPGQGSQYAGMGRGLYEQLPAFRAAIDRCSEIVRPVLGRDLSTLLYPAANVAHDEAALTPTAIAQPAIFAVEYALAQVWMQWGIRPSAMIGHSVGEYVAACLAGVMSLEDALALVAERGRLIQALPAGAMLAVRLAEAELSPHLGPALCLAAINAPALCVAAGPLDDIAALEQILTGRGVAHRRLETSHAFHSPMMDDAVAPLVERARSVRFAEPEIPYVSGVTGTWVTPAEATSAAYWGRHCREPVRFAAGITTLVDDVSALLEVGPGSALASLASQGAGKSGGRTILTSLAGAAESHDDRARMLESLGRLWLAGARPDWPALHGPNERRRVPLPTYPFERARYWIDTETIDTASSVVRPPDVNPIPESIQMNGALKPGPVETASARAARVQRDIATLLEELSGDVIGPGDEDRSFLELGFDSLFLGRFVQQLQTRFDVAVSFRQLLGDIPSIAALTEYVVARMPPEIEAAETPAAAPPAAAAPASSSVETVMRDQLQAMQQLIREQLAVLQNLPPASSAATTLPAAAPAIERGTAGTPERRPSRFDVYRSGGSAARADMTSEQRAHIDALIARTIARTRGSKEQTQRYRSVLADPRSAAGFRAEWKEMVYPIVAVRAHGSRIWDVDGNEYIDILNGFGQTFFGHAPDFVVDAVAAKLGDGFAIGPQTELAGEVAELFCEITGNERVTFCNTGSEAVMAAMRVARAVTGRNRVVVFDGAYHGQFDEVLVTGARRAQRSLPAATGIPPESVSNMTVLPYAADESLAWIREHAAELAAVIVEPVQSRHPGLQPKAFLTELRAITAASGTALVFDEVVTGFRIDPAGMQNVFGIRADLATYGKVVGGGLPVGILAGRARFMDALDGGMWQFGDDSFPEVAPTFFAGTFVRHPLVMAAVRSVLLHVKAAGSAMQAAVSERTSRLVERLNAELTRRGITAPIERCGSLFYMNLAGVDRFSSLLYFHLRERGVYVLEGFPCFLTTEHTDADVEQIVSAFSDSLDALADVGILSTGQRAAAAAQACDVALTEEQTEVWLAAQLGDDASRAFNESVTLRLTGPLDEAAFAASWNRLRERHDALRATFSPTGETMRVAAGGAFAYTLADVSSGSAGDRERALAERIDADARTPFDLVDGPLVRGCLVRLAPEDHAFVLTAHHIICDGWSVNVLLEEFAAIYSALRRGAAVELPAPLSFVEYARDQRAREAAELATIETFWIDQFATPVPQLELPTDRPRAMIRSFAGATRSATIAREKYTAIKKAGALAGCTLFSTLFGGFAMLMGRLAGQRDVAVGVPSAGQSLLDDAILVGHCVHFLPIRARWNAGDRVSDVLRSVKQTVLDAYEHQPYTLGTLVRKLDLPRETGRLPLTEIQFNLERLADGLALPDLGVRVEPNAKAYVNFDLFLNVVESSDGLRLDCDYNTDLFDASTIDRWLRSYERMLDAIVADATTVVDRVSYLPDAERQAVVHSNQTASEYPRDLPLHALFEQQAARRPGAVAVTCGAESLTYYELDRRANQLAHYLRAHVNGAERLVGVAVDRSTDMLVALLAVLKAGCAYIPLDRRNPPARLRHMLEESEAAAIVTDDAPGAAAFVPPGVVAIDIRREAGAIDAQPESALPHALAPDALAYVIYTSGSTGVPKGVEITHRSVVNFLTSMAREPGLDEGAVFVAVTTIAFDIAALELFLPLAVGATVTIADGSETTDGFRLLERINASGATAMQATPATWRMLLEAGFRARAGFTMLCGGEALPRDLANRLLEGDGRLWNMYGPTETTIWSSCGEVTAGDHVISAGRPIANTQFHILDERDEPVGIGQTGQLHIGGDGLARGYVKRPETNAEKFIPNPFGAGRLYRTGDSARLLPRGEVQILGRIDHQVKLRGFRIELGEIEAVLDKKAGLAASAVALREDPAGSARLVGYIVERAGDPRTPAELSALLAEDLPEYMIPSAWVRLNALPTSTNGKLDRASLPAPQFDEAAAFTAPTTPLEITLAEIWADVLKLDRVDIGTDLFALGADSINLFQITARAHREGVPLMAKQLLKHRTIAELARFLETAPPQPVAARAPRELVRSSVSR